MNEYMKILVFQIGQEFYAADIMEVERILGYEETTELPDAPSFVRGVINYEGSILPIISIEDRFGLKGLGSVEESKIIVAKNDTNRIGILVDVVTEVRDIKAEIVEVPPAVVSGISKRYLKGLIKLDGKIIIFLNLGAILTEEEKNELAR